MSYFGHLVSRFFGSLRPGGPSAENCAWVKSVLTDAEFSRWSQLSGPDRRHSVMVARTVDQSLPIQNSQAKDDEINELILRAALLHDSGKLEAKLHTPGRVLATLIGSQLSCAQKEQWAEKRGWRGRIGRYLCHPIIGADALSEIGTDDFVVEWTRQHHLSSTECTLPAQYANVLRAADND